MLTLIGLLIIITIVALLMTGKSNPILAMSIIPLIGALIAGFSISEISSFFEAGMMKVTKVAVMFLFAILFFSILKELHIFDPMIRHLVKLTRGNVVLVAMMTALIAAIVHLDGSGAATFLIIIPALLPLYKKLGMSPYLMLLLMAGSMGIMNMVPWGGPLGRASAVTGIEASLLWQNIIPVQIVGIVGMMAFAAIMGLREKKRIQVAAIHGTTPFQQDCTLTDLAEDTDDGQVRKPKNFWFNIALILISIICLAFGLFSAPYVFMLALSLVLLVNFPKPRQQIEVISRHAPQALNMVAIIFAAGAFLGILSESGMLKAIALDLIHILPPTWVGSLHIAVGLLGVPLDIFTSTDAYYFALLPVIGEVTATAGVSIDSVVYAMAIGNNAGTFVSPFSPATWLAMGLAGTDMGKHLKYSFGWIWLVGLFVVAVGYFMGLY
ncbi:CitMHS family citrate-Mg2+:H+ or citrate-Ca2+:H+ symporter [Acinetobacter baylyi]|uniref:CitMHS family citrate-Mg2+:H+ or citrate-Ca2+:H+ symporter n=1 Tax=Acinetobacter baylyi TaxID=202950 RepID=A0ABU0US71_ACIBI|nr:citrate:proton symporter [Acinetobacter baylyi]MDQ1207399.1 CitMHS family citrate-Mg2+:H+ or citrate-Ca2+:H+ symporter [Acinetobacter baylyi]MDR6105520.1 CitMHS family citrate-Mg2+:H+ or citrate-Ca2+:H+ symporter [Acinetobacter baylyi]MDR6184270.1 CitMHS family citrate-Mg2+:H+ or citrate-Ca2+:H+ symporter [Acinetobacter baylyi]